MKKILSFMIFLLCVPSFVSANPIGYGWNLQEVNNRNVMGIIYVGNGTSLWNLNEKIGLNTDDNECISTSFIKTGKNGLYFTSRCDNSTGLYLLSKDGKVKKLSSHLIENYQLLTRNRIKITWFDNSNQVSKKQTLILK